MVRSSTGLPSLDALLGGGWEGGELVEICGQSNSGKTLLVIYTVLLHLLLNPNHRVVFIDTLSTFDPFRFNAIAGLIIADLRRRRISLGRQNEGIGWEIISERALSRLDVTKCITSGRTIDAIVGSIEDTTKEEKMTMVVIDTATNLLSGDLAAVVVNNNQSTSCLRKFSNFCYSFPFLNSDFQSSTSSSSKSNIILTSIIFSRSIIYRSIHCHLN